jgi:3-oxoacyl-[acyl-carrier protein] reductase
VSEPASPTRDWALVTGASRGIGRAIALELGAAGLHVVLNYRASAPQAEAVAQEIRAAGGSAECCAFDVADGDAARAALEALLATHGAPLVLVNNAGITRDGLFVWMKPEDWRAVLETNLSSFYNVTQPLLKPMLSARRGRIVNITSTAGQTGNPGQVNYSAAKAGLIGATKALAKEIAKRGITVNAVAPGFVESDMTAAISLDRIRASVPAGRMGLPAEVAAVVRFLTTDGAAYITGQVIAVNGGLV